MFLQAIFRGYEQCSELSITRGWKLFTLLPRLLLFRRRKGGKWKSVSDCFRKADGWNCWLSAGRESAKSISLPSDADAGKGRTMEFRRPWTGHTFGAFGRVVCSTSSPRRRQRCAGNDGHIKITDKPDSSSACGQTCTEPRDLAIGTNGGSSIGW